MCIRDRVKGVSGAGPITHFDASKFKTHFACEVKNFNGTDYIDRKELRKMDLYTQYALSLIHIFSLCLSAR